MPTSFPYGSAIGIPADELIPYQARPPGFRRRRRGQQHCRIPPRHRRPDPHRLYAFVHIANIGLAGFPVPELYNIDFAQTEAAAKAVAENADLVLGIKVRMSENVIAKHGLEPLKRAIQACEMAGTGAKVMCHIGGVETPELMSQILDHAAPGDVLTHAIPAPPTSPASSPISCRTASCCRRRWRPSSAASCSTWATAAAASITRSPRWPWPPAAGPDTISSDIHVFSGNTPGMPYLTWVMSKFLNMGLYARAGRGHGNRQPGQGRSIAPPSSARCRWARRRTCRCWRSSKGPVEFVDTRNNKRQGKVHIKPAGVVLAGVPYGRPYQAPFAIR